MKPSRYWVGSAFTDTTAPREAAMAWFRDAKFGLFLHYGLYLLLAGVYKGEDVPRRGTEWIRLGAPVPASEYTTQPQILTNVWLNTGSKDDGSLPDEDVVTLREAGRRLRAGEDWAP